MSVTLALKSEYLIKEVLRFFFIKKKKKSIVIDCFYMVYDKKNELRRKVYTITQYFLKYRKMRFTSAQKTVGTFVSQNKYVMYP